MVNRMALRRLIVSLFGVIALAAQIRVASAQDAPSPLAVRGDSARGKLLYQACQSCHSIEDNDLGPRHRGIVGRRAGSLTDYNYSPALKSAGLIWDPANLDRWLTNPSALVPGTKMFFKIDDAQSRADIIAYLTALK
jgi:cytochrome c